MVFKSAFGLSVRSLTASLIGALHWGAVAAGATSAGAVGAPPDGARALTIPAPVADSLRAAGIAMGGLGLALRPLDGRGPVLEHQASRPFNPASTMKLVTTYVALGVLGPDYRWRTTIHAGGPIVGDRLRGDLILRGGGDPKLVVEDLTE